MGNRVEVFGCGVQKAGTTSLYAHLSTHPQLFAPSRKELHFFDDESRDWSAPDYAELEAAHPAPDKDGLRFDVTPIYGFWPRSLERICDYNPDAKLIFLFRDPFERAVSHWCMEYARGDERLPFAVAIREGRARLEGLPDNAPERRVFSYLERGFYGAQAARALKLFPKKSLLFLKSTDLWRDPAAALARISDFLGIDAFQDVQPKHEFERVDLAYPSTPSGDDLDLFRTTLGQDLQVFASLTGLDISDWPTFAPVNGGRVDVAPAASQARFVPNTKNPLARRPTAGTHNRDMVNGRQHVIPAGLSKC